MPVHLVAAALVACAVALVSSQREAELNNRVCAFPFEHLGKQHWQCIKASGQDQVCKNVIGQWTRPSLGGCVAVLRMPQLGMLLGTAGDEEFIEFAIASGDPSDPAGLSDGGVPDIGPSSSGNAAGSLSGGAIAGIVLACLAVLGCLTAAVFGGLTKHKQIKPAKDVSFEDEATAAAQSAGGVNLQLGVRTEAARHNVPDPSRVAEQAEQ